MLFNSVFFSDLDAAHSKLKDASYIDALKIYSYLEDVFTITINKEKNAFNENENNIAKLRSIIDSNNKITSSIENKFSLDNKINVISDLEINKLKNLLSTNTCNQWNISNEIVSSSEIIDKTINKNISVLEKMHLSLIQERLKFKDIRKEKSDRINKNIELIKKLSIAFSIFSGIAGCSVKIVNTEPGRQPFAPIGYFLLFYAIAYAIGFGLNSILKSNEMDYKKESYQEVEISTKADILNQLIDVLKRLDNSFLYYNIRFPENHKSFNEYFES
jgi:hypothetical protein